MSEVMVQNLIPSNVNTSVLNPDGVVYILHHADSDGRFAGHCVIRWLITNEISVLIRCHEVQYGQELPIQIENLRPIDSVYIVDFSYKREILEKVSATGCYLMVLDHHKTAMNELTGFKQAYFDMSMSGALLAWRFFFPNSDIPFVCELVNDRDLWTKKYSESRALEAYLRKHIERDLDSDYTLWNNLISNHEGALDSAIKEGEQIVEFEDLIINKIYDSNRHSVGTLEYSGSDKAVIYAIYNCPGVYHSEIAEKYYSTLEIDFVISWRDLGDGYVRFSLRSPGKVDVSAIAKSFGGGGHSGAAGFALIRSEAFSLIDKFSYKAKT